MQMNININGNSHSLPHKNKRQAPRASVNQKRQGNGPRPVSRQQGIRPQPNIQQRTASQNNMNSSRGPQDLRRMKPAPGRRNALVNLGYIGTQIAAYVTKLTHHKIGPQDIMIYYLGSDASAIAYCQKQYNFYLNRNRPDLTPLYFYNGSNQQVVRMGDTMGGLKEAKDAINKASGLNLTFIRNLLVNK